MSNVFVNGRLALNAGDGLTQTCPVPDVCKTPSPGGPVPVPYVNVAQDSDLAKGTKKVTVEGRSVALQGSNLSTSTGDEAGTAGGGLISSKTKGKLTWATYSPDVKFEGKSVVRFLDVCLHNGNANNTGGNPAIGTPGLTYGGDGKCPICGKADGHSIKSDEESQARAKKLYKDIHTHKQPYRQEVKGKKVQPKEGFMAGVLVCRVLGGKRFFMQMHSGPEVPRFPLKPPSKAALQHPDHKAKEFHFKTRSGKRVVAKFDEDCGNKPGNCAAARLIREANERGYIIESMTEFWVGPSTDTKKDGHDYESCETCKQLLPAMLCDTPDENTKSKGKGKQSSNESDEPITLHFRNPKAKP